MKKFINSVLIFMISCGLMFTPGLVMGDTTPTGDLGDSNAGVLVTDTDDGVQHLLSGFEIVGDVDFMNNIHIDDIHSTNLASFGHILYNYQNPFKPFALRIDHNSDDGFYLAIWADKGVKIDKSAVNIMGTGASHPSGNSPFSVASGTYHLDDPGDVEFACFIRDDGTSYDSWVASSESRNTGKYVFYRIFLEEYEDAHSDEADAAISGTHDQGRLFVNPNNANDKMSRFTVGNHDSYDDDGLTPGNASLHEVQTTLVDAENHARMITALSSPPTLASASQYDFFYEYTPAKSGGSNESYMAMAHYGWKVNMYIPEALQLFDGPFKTVLNFSIIDK